MRRRTLLAWTAIALAERLASAGRAEASRTRPKAVIVTLGGVRRQESFSEEGAANIPHLAGDLADRAIFYPFTWNQGTTAHFNTIASVLTGVWQHVDDWGRDRPADASLLQYLQQQWNVPPAETWVVTSNKALTANIAVGANVVLAKQLLVEAVERIILGKSSRHRLDRELLLGELTAIMQDDYERIGWSVSSRSSIMDPELRTAFLSALAKFIDGPESPASGDELTWFVATEVLRRVSPSVLVINFSDVEVAHSGTYSLHLSGIRRNDLLVYRLWNFLQTLPSYRDNVTMLVMPEFGRDPDGSTTNGFFNHRSDTSSCRLTWAMVLGSAVHKPAIVRKEVQQIDFAPSLGAFLGVSCGGAAGHVLTEFGG